MAAVLASAGHPGWVLAVATGKTRWPNTEEAPPHTFGLWLGIGMLIGAIALVSAGIRLHRQRQLRAISVLPDDPFAVDAMRAAVETFCAMDPAWRRRDQAELTRLASSTLLSSWRPRL